MNNNPQKVPRELTLEECEKISGGTNFVYPKPYPPFKKHNPWRSPGYIFMTVGKMTRIS